MNSLIPRHIKHQLLLLVIIAMLPQFIAITYQNYLELRQDMRGAHNKAMMMADAVAVQQKNTEISSRQLLSTLAILPEVKRMDSDECDTLFAQLVVQNPQFHTVAAIAADGTTFASAIQGTRSYLGDRKYFKDAMANRTFSFGESVVSRSVNRPTFHYSIPFEGISGRLSGVLYVALDLRNAANLINIADLPRKSEISLYDHAGKQIFSVPGDGKAASLPSDQFDSMLKGNEKGSFSYHRTDGDFNIVAYRRIIFDISKTSHLFVRVTIPEKEISAPIYKKLWQQMLRLCSTTIIALLLAWFIGEHLVARKVRRVIEVAEKLGSGNLKERIGMDDVEGDIGHLARTIDRLGAALEMEDTRRVSVEEELRVFNTELDERVRERTTELSKMNTLFTRLAEQSRTVVWEVNAEGLYTYISEMSEPVYGFRPDEVVGRLHFYDMLTSSERNTIMEAAFEIFRRKQPFINLEHGSIRNDSDKSIWVVTNGLPVLDDDGTLLGYRGTDTDITENRKLQEQLQQSLKLESIGRLAGGIAHDFNNKLSVIMGYAQLADEDLSEDNDTIRDYLSEITRAAEFSRDIVGKLLTFSHQQIIMPQKIDPNRAILEMQKSLIPLIGEDVSLTFNPGYGIRSIFMDPVQLDQILMNLAVNARDAMQGGGSLTIETSNHSINEDASARTACQSGDYIMIAVSDTGCGMDEETLSHIFEPFFTTKEVGKGTGLGLATIHGIVSQNNGCIEVESTTGSGTEFRIFLPSHTEGESAADTEEALLLKLDVSIMLVEDDDSVREVTAKLLRRAGCDVTECSSPRMAIEIFEKGEFSFDLILTDIIMPGMNGRDMAERIREINNSVKVIYMSGYSRDVIEQKLLITEQIALIHKPVNITELKRKITELLESGGELQG